MREALHRRVCVRDCLKSLTRFVLNEADAFDFSVLNLGEGKRLVLSVDHMPYIPPITPERWISNLLEAAGAIANRTMQEERWATGTWNIREHPEELINTVDAYVLDGFIEAFASTFNIEQNSAIREFSKEFGKFCVESDETLDPPQVLVDSRWEILRQRAATFVKAFQDRWPEQGSEKEVNQLLQIWMNSFPRKNE